MLRAFERAALSIRPLLLAFLVATGAASTSSATTINEVLEPPETPGNAWSGTFVITPSTPTWAFGVGNADIQDVSISGIAFIDGLEANDHWVATLISKNAWTNLGYDFDTPPPFGTSGPSAFSIDTTSIPWQWGSSDYVAFYWLSKIGPNPSSPLGVLQPGSSYDAFKFFTSGPDSPFASFGAADGGAITAGETVVSIVPEPSTALLLGGGVLCLATIRRRQSRRS